MSTRVIIIHAADIISHGLSGIIKIKFNIDAITIKSTDNLANYTGIKAQKIIILVDANLDSKQVSIATKSFHNQNHLKIILIYAHKEQIPSNDQVDCCFSIDASTDKIVEVLNPYLSPNKNPASKKSSYGLTEREIDVVKLVAFGKTNKEIAEELFISIHTVISHRKNITEKLGIKSISGLTVFAILNNLIDAEAIDITELI